MFRQTSKAKFGYGSVWTWVALDADTKLVPSWGALERAERVQHIRIVRFWRSTKLVEMCFGSGLPVTAIERHPMSMRRFTRLTNGFSKKVENLGYSVALHLYVVQLC